MDNNRNLILSEDNVNEEDDTTLQVFTEEEMKDEVNALDEITHKTNRLLKKRYDSTRFNKIPINELLINMANKTIDVFKELGDIALRPPKLKYQDKFKWWMKYKIYFNKIMEVLKKDDRLVYFGLFLVLLAFLLNFFNMTV